MENDRTRIELSGTRACLWRAVVRATGQAHPSVGLEIERESDLAEPGHGGSHVVVRYARFIGQRCRVDPRRPELAQSLQQAQVQFSEHAS